MQTELIEMEIPLFIGLLTEKKKHPPSRATFFFLSHFLKNLSKTSAVAQENANILKILLLHPGINPEIRNSDNNTALEVIDFAVENDESAKTLQQVFKDCFEEIKKRKQLMEIYINSNTSSNNSNNNGSSSNNSNNSNSNNPRDANEELLDDLMKQIKKE